MMGWQAASSQLLQICLDHGVGEDILRVEILNLEGSLLVFFGKMTLSKSAKGRSN